MKIRLELRKGKAMVIKPKSDSNQPQVVVKLFLSKRTLPNVGCGFLEIYSVSRNSEDGRLTSEQTCARVRISEGSDVFDFWVTLIERSITPPVSSITPRIAYRKADELSGQGVGLSREL
jgi:hypothetical protein